MQAWGDNVDFVNKTLTAEEAVDDPRQGLALTASRNATEESTEQNGKLAKGKRFKLTYDKLAIAVGCYSQTFDIPGVREHALFLKDVGDARRIRNQLLTCKATSQSYQHTVACKSAFTFLHSTHLRSLSKPYPTRNPGHQVTSQSSLAKKLLVPFG